MSLSPNEVLHRSTYTTIRSTACPSFVSCTPEPLDEIKERFHIITKTYYISGVDTIFFWG